MFIEKFNRYKSSVYDQMSKDIKNWRYE